MKIEKGVLKSVLAVLGKVVRKSSVVEQYKSVRFVGIQESFKVQAVATDGEQCVAVTVEAADSNGADFAVPFAELEQLASDCQGDAVEFEGKYLEFPAVPTPPEDAETIELPCNFGTLLALALPVVQCDADQEVLRGVNLSKHGITAANSKMLVHFPCPVTLTKDVTLPFPEPLLAEQIAEKGSLQLWENNFLLKTPSIKWQGKLFEGEYPDWRAVVPSKQHLTSKAVLPEPEKIIAWLKNIPKLEKDDLIAIKFDSSSSLELTAYNRPEYKLSFDTSQLLPSEGLRLDREHLLTALQLGFTTLEVGCPLNPVVMSGKKGGQCHYARPAGFRTFSKGKKEKFLKKNCAMAEIAVGCGMAAFSVGLRETFAGRHETGDPYE